MRGHFPRRVPPPNRGTTAAAIRSGVWQILQTRPSTPVFACWIEGGWGSYTSYSKGPPTKNKKPDFRRPLGVGVATAITVPAEILDDHLRTRFHLMNLVVAARKHLGLSPLPSYELPHKEDEKADEPDEAEETRVDPQ